MCKWDRRIHTNLHVTCRQRSSADPLPLSMPFYRIARTSEKALPHRYIKIYSLKLSGYIPGDGHPLPPSSQAAVILSFFFLVWSLRHQDTAAVVPRAPFMLSREPSVKALTIRTPSVHPSGERRLVTYDRIRRCDALSPSMPFYRIARTSETAHRHRYRVNQQKQTTRRTLNGNNVKSSKQIVMRFYTAQHQFNLHPSSKF